MKLVVGLGNPGRRYQGTRHNVGFAVLDKLVERAQNLKRKVQNYNLKLKTNDWQLSTQGKLEYLWMEFGEERVELVKPLTFMNTSGEALAYILKKHPTLSMDEIYVMHDDLDISLGKYKIQFGKGPREHGGLTSIYQSLGNREFWHVRIGIENRIQQAQSVKLKVQSVDSLQHFQIQKTSDSIRISGEKYVLQRFAEEEKAVIERVIRTVVDDLLGSLTEA